MAPSVQKLDSEIRYQSVFSICTIVTNIDQYKSMIDAYVLRGFDDSECEFAYIDNTAENQADAFQAFNIFLTHCRAKYIIFCHQDIEPIDSKQQLIDKIEELSKLDAKWGLFGNAGANARGELQVRISDPHGTDTSKGGPFPSKVLTLDENFILMKRETNITLSRDIGGFHWYGFELCMMAEALGWTAYVVDFHVKHYSKGNPDPTYFHTAKAISKKYSVLFRSRWIISPTKAQLYISSSPARSIVARISYKMLGKKGR